MKTTRREFLKEAIIAGAICSSSLMPVGSVFGRVEKRNGIVDVHHHILPQAYISSLGQIGITTVNGASFPKWDAREALDAMDRSGIETAFTSISAPGIYFGDMQFTRVLARQCNEYSARLVADYPGRFGAFGVLPLPDVDASLAEISYLFDVLKLNGIILLSNIDGVYPGEPPFHDVFAELDRRKAVVFIHPTEPAGKKFPGMKIPPSFFEFVFDTTRAIASLIQYNTIERFPDIRFIVAHAGGAAPYLLKKLELTAQLFSGWQGKQAASQLQKVYYDTALSTSPSTLSLLQSFAGEDQIVFGSDSGFAPEYIVTNSIYEVKHSGVFGESGQKKIFKNNSIQLFDEDLCGV